MNVANLQLEGLMMAVAAINNALVHHGVLSIDAIDDALRRAEASVTADERVYEDMSPAHREAICFPLRLLQLANLSQDETGVPPFAELARQVGRTKDAPADPA
ncbi:hypothetical protein EOA27_32490 [Mesorhizobium sp. M2A.F.Ca.ET.037.01.1.1]|uniref:hypothetical protein n=1 Tax=unclassified Mesorhizobium TaxID=325217 RepID=UPI000F7599ED|nr:MULTISPECIES: hypothetical protein [unclassified Mesorhizobium]RUY02016.1 hypothetical protein EOA25_22095 [Mesorhizobium sp. M2A.F.Ca.ET.040.01.1.1]AZO01640.1 hypothetical protein EJ068_00115 [Mesorhizobium sp. M2A.F.Ca.ET.043.02.1.1]RUW42975.1 hypothetical protein EOA37_02115 [Mesorhizobium sp. M2A.F.Ca.ET.015.02.1.1]RUX02163.1 hypothetical protein EOA27_32490 [Mesorhizobium sp. M2A.F.Ca.ET.037.01.1.1]RVC93862.1 hypothetical protein EN739_19485 [Mesorhizobium sp. M2A.F.Ca.ET.017.03.2.1]